MPLNTTMLINLSPDTTEYKQQQTGKKITQKILNFLSQSLKIVNLYTTTI